MKFLLLGVLAFFLAGSTRQEPRIEHQVSVMVLHQDGSPTWERRIKIYNPLRQGVWVYVECDSSLTSNPIGVSARRTDEFVFPGIPPGEVCSINHWRVQVPGKSPPQWRP